MLTFWDTFFWAFLAGSFLGMINAFTFLTEIWNPVFHGIERYSIIIFSVSVIAGWWSILVWQTLRLN